MKRIKRTFFSCLLFMMMLFSVKIDSSAAEVIIEDNASLLTDEEEQQLLETMEKVSQYGGVAFITNSQNNAIESASAYAKEKCRAYFHGESGTVFLIDMYNRRIEIFSTGKIYKKIRKSRANAITDQTFVYATNGHYFQCADETFKSMLIILEGGKVSTPLKYVSNLFMAFGISMLVFYLILYHQRKSIYKIGVKLDDEVLGLSASRNVIITKEKMTSRRKTVHTDSSDSSGGSSGGGGGSSGGGGGGGHSF